MDGKNYEVARVVTKANSYIESANSEERRANFSAVGLRVSPYE